MSRAFVKDDDGYEPPAQFGLPPVEDPSYPAAAALVLLEAARDGRTHLAEDATGYRWGEPVLRPFVRRLLDKELERPEDERDHRFVQLARRWLRAR